MNRGRPAKKIMCLNDRKIYDSVADAAKAYSISSSAISQIIHNKRTAVRGLYFISILGTENIQELENIRNKALYEKCNIII